MKRKILPLLAIYIFLFSSYSSAQRNTAFAVTAPNKGNFNWNVIREIDLSTGEVIRTIYDPTVNKAINYTAAAGTELKNNFVPSSATGPGVAAAAFDALHNRLYFTGMRADHLSYFDFTSSDLNVVINNNPAFNTGSKGDEANVITRMAFTVDGIGYAISNDGKNFIRFTTDAKPVVTNLGSLTDGSKNGKISIHNQSTSWGGDVVGDAYGNLYLVTYRNHMFRINPNTKVADYLGMIKGLPANFTSNGIVVDNDGKLVVSSATTTDNYYNVNISTLDATPLPKKEEQVYNSSDLASSNLLYQKKGVPNLLFNDIKVNTALNVFPNPVNGKFFNLQFAKVPAGRYNMVLTDASGRAVLSRTLNVAMANQVERINLPRTAGGGTYLIKLVGGRGNTAYNEKLVVQ